MIEQASFDFTPPPSPAPGEVEILTAYLEQNPGFHTAKQLSQALAWSDRQIRQLAELSNGLIVSGPGSPGYIHLHHCPTEKLTHITDKLISQGRLMIRRALRIRETAHRLIR